MAARRRPYKRLTRGGGENIVGLTEKNDEMLMINALRGEGR